LDYEINKKFIFPHALNLEEFLDVLMLFISKKKEGSCEWERAVEEAGLGFKCKKEKN
jgi:hypothetical protein